MVTSENGIVKAAAGIADPAVRARHCQEFLVNGRATIREMERLRDDAIREARAARHPEAKTVNRLAEFIRTRRNVVVDALRHRERP
ncbi:hypothetical protein O7626_39945 [Micromonospora sp. WMMD1102]|uniref:hypothetical protein n=1 Tax=Micromonospora sp. WMMD1102 TaxID=3016105 RepID=UPI002414DAF3|nr:hypothetical protein [Micromonospora sp. WMMD1102]MDG4791989.1 hypothetical protein [Micromonospora sp. WMMD1102]